MTLKCTWSQIPTLRRQRQCQYDSFVHFPSIDLSRHLNLKLSTDSAVQEHWCKKISALKLDYDKTTTVQTSPLCILNEVNNNIFRRFKQLLMNGNNCNEAKHKQYLKIFNMSSEWHWQWHWHWVGLQRPGIRTSSTDAPATTQHQPPQSHNKSFTYNHFWILKKKNGVIFWFYHFNPLWSCFCLHF